MSKIKVFLSYSWDSEEHHKWVEKFADSLEELEELNVIWDGYDLDSLVDKNEYMQLGVFESDYIMVVATLQYKEKADLRKGGVGIETYMSSAAHWEELQKTKKTKVIIALRERDAIPNYLKGQLYIDFSKDQDFEESRKKVVNNLLGTGQCQRRCRIFFKKTFTFQPGSAPLPG